MSDQGVKLPPESQQIGHEPSAPEPTLREQVSHAFSELKAKEAPDPATIKTPEKAEPAATRDEAGKFAAKPTDAKRETLTLPAKESAPVVAPVTKAPDGWTPELKAKFPGLDPAIQQEILRREDQIKKGLASGDEDRSLGKRIRETSSPYLATIKAEGGTPEAAFGAFLNYAHIMRTGSAQQKLAALQTVAQQFNVPLGSQPQQAAPNQGLETVNQRLDRLERERQADLHQRQVQEQSALSSEIDAFEAEAGHDHFPAVKVLMGTLMQMENGPKTLQEAYDQAIWANPEIRSTLTAAQIAEVEQKRLSQTQATTGAAKWASGSVIGAPGGSKPNGVIAERSLGDEIRANMKAATGRV